MLESPDPLGMAALRAADGLEQGLGKIPNVEAHSLSGSVSPLQLLGRNQRRGGGALAQPSPPGPTLFRRAGLLGNDYLGIALELQVKSPADRDLALKAIDALALPLESTGGPITKVRRVGSPWLDAWLEKSDGRRHRALSCRCSAFS
jgi:hypothetical protein